MACPYLGGLGPFQTRSLDLTRLSLTATVNCPNILPSSPSPSTLPVTPGTARTWRKNHNKAMAMAVAASNSRWAQCSESLLFCVEVGDDYRRWRASLRTKLDGHVYARRPLTAHLRGRQRRPFNNTKKGDKHSLIGDLAVIGISLYKTVPPGHKQLLPTTLFAVSRLRSRTTSSQTVSTLSMTRYLLYSCLSALLGEHFGLYHVSPQSLSK